jgi:hypothetical protein
MGECDFLAAVVQVASHDWFQAIKLYSLIFNVSANDVTALYFS